MSVTAEETLTVERPVGRSATKPGKDTGVSETKVNPVKGNGSRATLEVGMMVGFGLLFLAVWEFLPPALGVPRYIIPTFSQCMAEFARMWAQEDLGPNFISTLISSIVGFGLGALLGAGAGYLLGMSKLWERVLAPYILALQIAPKVAFAPLFIMWFGYNSIPKLLVTVLIVFFPILVNVLQSMKTVDQDLMNLARVYSMSRWKMFLKIELPSSLPQLFAGLRISSTLAVIGVTVGELVGGNTGLGFLITYGEGQANTAMVFDAIILLTIIGVALYFAVAAVEKRVLHYLERNDG
ncbi:ABC transporter permease [Pseudooceanicola sediminis]|uniref:ABC transporter permease n=1 Tax=Pseudooceanicola sediminis TaxID=2211117 RepID=A0A399JB33_9RHOB|nr:ABC transporter permease [Puniceibacterium sp. HSS470]RII39846.1 ABC transporter permease [Pseudooceanicola sediminis]|tara:strand:+ start:29153 stop:30037 length:885 start_codon:yes stop_codon:yes gene_type:complete